MPTISYGNHKINDSDIVIIHNLIVFYMYVDNIIFKIIDWNFYYFNHISYSKMYTHFFV